jgi:hypothetical protein
MKVTLEHQPDVMGHEIRVVVTAASSERIARVETKLDGFTLAADALSPPAGTYDRTFSQVGNYTPGWDHTAVATAVDQKGGQTPGVEKWRDS